MNNIELAIIALFNYISALRIDVFAIPVLTGKGIDIVIFDAIAFAEYIDTFYHTEKRLPNIVTMYTGEQFFRLSTVTSASSLEKPPILKRIETIYKKYDSWPAHQEMKARGFEKIVALYTGGKHTGDNISEVDVIAPNFLPKAYPNKTELRIEVGTRKKRMIKQTRIDS